MIILYTTHCPKCKVLETKLNDLHISSTIRKIRSLFILVRFLWTIRCMI